MEIKSLEISNIGMIGHEIIPIDKHLLLFYGDIKQGKTTILNSVKLCFGGRFPRDIIKHGEKEAFVCIKFDEGSIKRKFRIAKDGTTKADKIEFVNNGEVEDEPVNAIKKFLNPFLLDQNHLFNMSGPERDRFFVDLFGVDTSAFDKESSILELKAKDLRSEIKGFGEIDLTPVEKPDIASLKLEKVNINAENEKIKKGYQEEIYAIRDYNIRVMSRDNERSRKSEIKERNLREIEDLKKQIIQYETENENIDKYLMDNPSFIKKENPQEPEYKSTTEIDEKISQANADEVRYENYLDRVKRSEEKNGKIADLKTNTNRQGEIKKSKIAKLAEISKTIDIDSLSFDNNGDFVYDGTSAGMLSTSQIMTLSNELSKLYPDSMGLELIDRGESLGWNHTNLEKTSVSVFVKQAKDEKKTILATVVGDEPAKIPEDVGVFIVKNGNIKHQSSL